MIKFFRKIRQRLLVENKFGKYLTYAIGEILLIVIGIFIAIQLSNLNENNNIHNKQIKHLKGIRNEMLNNLTAIKEIEELSYSIMEAERKIIDHKATDSITEKEFSAIFIAITFNELIVPIENGTLNEIISSGGLKDIENDSIRNILASWEGRKTGLISQEKELADVRNKIVNILKYKGSLNTIIDNERHRKLLNIELPVESSNLHLLESRTFKNEVLNHMMLTHYLGYIIYPKIYSDIQLLINLIDNELSK